MDRDTQTDRQREEALVGGFHGRTKKGWKRQGKRERRREKTMGVERDEGEEG